MHLVYRILITGASSRVPHLSKVLGKRFETLVHQGHLGGHFSEVFLGLLMELRHDLVNILICERYATQANVASTAHTVQSIKALRAFPVPKKTDRFAHTPEGMLRSFVGPLGCLSFPAHVYLW
jgi:hypothetical protein